MISRPRFSTEAGRLEAFSDGVIAVIITIMVLELRPPDGTDLHSLHALIPTFAAYVLSFVFIGIYWNNHHHMLRASDGIDGRVMWANLHLLFWLSLAPLTTAWLGRNPFAPIPTALYGFVLAMDAIAFFILQAALVDVNGRGGAFAKAVDADVKGKASLALYLSGIAISFFSTIAADALYVAVAVMWIVPDRRFESVIAKRSDVRKSAGAQGGRTPE
ncbi:MAG TPA: TMEM175 family protein [Candidatus Cybelea sp.]|nr:TMEM175 family protein [Candidatus Cybelea sp.]